MTVSNQTPYVEYTANGSTTNFALTFDCDNADNLIVKVNDVEAIGTWTLQGSTVVFITAPIANSIVSIERNTPLERTSNYQTYDDSFSPKPVNKDFDRIWHKLQELGYRDQVIWLALFKEISDRILGDNNLQNQIDLLEQQVDWNTQDIAQLVDGLSREIADRIANDLALKTMFLSMMDEAINHGTVNALAITHVNSIEELGEIANVWDGRTIYVKDVGNYSYNAVTKEWKYAGKSFVTDDYITLSQAQANDGQIAFVKADGIAGEFRYDSTSTAAENGGTIIASVNDGNWVRLFSGEVQSTWFSSLQNFVNFVTNSAYQGAFEAKTYTLTETLTIPISSGFMLRGAGSDTVFTPATNFSGDALIRLVGYSRDVEFQLGSFKVTRGTNTTVQYGISIGTEDPNIGIRGLTYSNLWGISVDSFPTNWAICHARMITFDNCSGWNQPNDTAGENLLIYQKGKFTGDMVFNQCQFVATYQKNMGVNIQSNTGVYNPNNGDNSVCGLSFNDCDVYAGTTSFNAYAGNGSYIADIWCDGVQIDQQQDNGFKFIADGVGSLIQDIHINHSYVSKSNNNQIGFVALNGGTIANIWTQSNQIINVLNNGINFYRDAASTLKDLHVDDNSFPDPNTQSALIEFNGAKKFTCSGNHITEVFGQSTAKTVVNIEQGCENFTVFGNNDDDHTTSGTVLDASGDVKKSIFGNAGYNPISAQNITVEASPFVYKNTIGSPIVLCVSGGAVSDIKLSSGIGDIHFSPTENTQVTVPHGGLLTVTYTNVPNMYMYVI